MKYVMLILLQNSIFENSCLPNQKLYNPKDNLFLGFFMFLFSPQKSASHLLILICIIVAGIGFMFPQFIRLYGLNNWFLTIRDYPTLLVQIALFQFLHGSIMHLLMNSYFLYTA